MLPTVDFLGHKISRLIVGGNPFAGHVYIPWLKRSDTLDYYTAGKVVEALFRAEELGYTTCTLLAEDFALRVIHQYRHEGGKMNWIAQTHPPIMLQANLFGIMEEDPIAIFHQGTTTDTMIEAGQVEQLKENLKLIKATGKPTGLCTHVPETILWSEEEDWGVDFYMACAHNMRKRYKYESSFITGKRPEHKFYNEDRAEMFDVIRSVTKPCIAFKILSGGHLTKDAASLEGAFKETYENIKPNDIAVVGVFQKDKDQLEENANIVRKLLVD